MDKQTLISIAIGLTLGVMLVLIVENILFVIILIFLIWLLKQLFKMY